jgi:hypothetical protein
MYHGTRLAVLAVVLGVTSTVAAAEPTAAQRGEKALLGRHFTAPAISLKAYRNVWRFWEGDLKEAPADFDRLFRERYGMHEAPYPNKGYPMGLRERRRCWAARPSAWTAWSVTAAASSAKLRRPRQHLLDYQALTEEIAKASNLDPTTPFTFSHVRGTVEAGAMSVFLLSLASAAPAH